MKSDTGRTNMVLNSKLVEAGLEATGLKSRRELVDYALRELLRHKHKRKKGNMSIKCKVTWDSDSEDKRKPSR